MKYELQMDFLQIFCVFWNSSIKNKIKRHVSKNTSKQKLKFSAMNLKRLEKWKWKNSVSLSDFLQ